MQRRDSFEGKVSCIHSLHDMQCQWRIVPVRGPSRLGLGELERLNQFQAEPIGGNPSYLIRIFCLGCRTGLRHSSTASSIETRSERGPTCSLWLVSCHLTPASYPESPTSTMSSNLHVLSHPLINARLSKLRQTTTTSKEFREVCTDRAIYLKISLY